MTRWQELRATVTRHEDAVRHMQLTIRQARIVLQETACVREELALTQRRIETHFKFVRGKA